MAFAGASGHFDKSGSFAARCKQTLFCYLDDQIRMGIENRGNSPLAKSVIPCIEISTKPIGESARDR